MDQLEEILVEYTEILQLAFAVSDGLEGETSNIPNIYSCQNLALKIISHAATVLYLSKGTILTTLNPKFSFIDFSSIHVLTRIIQESYLKLYWVFFMPKSDDERIFRHASWELQGFSIRESANTKYIPENDVKRANDDITKIKNEIRDTNIFKKLTKKQQNQLLLGKYNPGFKWDEVANSSGINGDLFYQSYRYFSSYVHSDGLSGAQMMQATTRNDQINFIVGDIKLISGLLSKMIINYKNIFPTSKKICHENSEIFRKALFHSEIINQLP